MTEVGRMQVEDCPRLIEVRRMRAEDCPRVYEIEKICFSIPWSIESLYDTLERENYFYFVAEESGIIVGYAGICYSLDEGDIVNVAVDPRFRKKGIGERLLKQLFCEAVSRGISRIHLEVRKSNVPALALYQKNDFKSIAVRRGYYQEPTEDAIIMCKELPL